MKNKLELREREIETLTTKYNNTNEEKDTLEKENNTLKKQLELVINGFDGICTIINSF